MTTPNRGPDTKQIRVYVHKDLHTAVRIVAAMRGKCISDVASEILRTWVAHEMDGPEMKAVEAALGKVEGQ